MTDTNLVRFRAAVAGGLPSERGYEVTFVIGTVALALSTVAAVAAPGDSRRAAVEAPYVANAVRGHD